MKIINLIENTKGHPGCICEHGLSLYIETKKHKLLMDTGASDGFLKNARMLGIDLQKVDTVIISHGHYDHAGGVLPFAEQNRKAKIYLQRTANGAFYHLKENGDKYIGMDARILTLPQCVWLEGDCRLDDELFVFSGIRGRELWPQGNRTLKRKTAEGYVQDEFEHEQCLVIDEGKQRILVSGCAHNGVLNLLARFYELYQAYPDVLISGFHMMKGNAEAPASVYSEEETEEIRKTARILREKGILCYTGHCTGQYAFSVMKEIMGEKLTAIHSGEEITVSDASVHKKITLCGDNCMECPRYNAHSEDELRKAAELWYRVGWRSSVVSNEEISCSGCSSHKQCTYHLVTCTKEHNVEKCSQCSEFPCRKISDMLERSKEYQKKCLEVCTEQEYASLSKAFFEKEKNLKRTAL